MVFDKSDLPTTDIHESAIRMFEFPAQTNIPLSKTENNCFQSHLFFITLYQNNARKIQNKAVAACLLVFCQKKFLGSFLLENFL